MYSTCVWCGKRVPFGTSRCPECAKDYEAIKRRRAERKADRDEIQRFRSSQAWRDMRDAILEKYHYICQDCLEQGKTPIGVATEVHHIIPLYVDFSKRLDEDNLRPLCHDCHEVYSQEARRKWREKQRVQDEINEYLL